MKNIFQDILRTNDPEKSGGDRFSLSRISLFVSTLITLILVILPFFIDIDESVYDIMTNVIVMIVFLFAGYAFGGKVMSTTAKSKKEIEEIKNKMNN